ncbi:PPE family protein [Mycobacterium ulcerans str. Harvey]|uniref:PPE family protein n=1 Tax=Mycobacterium ulcerans str. Harvey TaxID=1299332 RepID=A0ABN0QPI9_MYCUL|nr:PPE family protein [Mycobacterium ulcerans str. Harvey]
MLTAATAWDGLATVLNSAAASYASVVSGLTLESRMGPASASMAAAAAPYATWLAVANEQARQTAAQARAAATAFETAFAVVVPPPLIAANRSQVASLVVANVLGQNTPAIETLQAEYAEMWAQDAAVMYQYSAASEAASTLAAFTSPVQSTDPSRAQASTAAGAAAAGTTAQTTASQPTTAATDTAQGLAAEVPTIPAGSDLAAPAAISIPTPVGELDLLAAYIAVAATASLSLSAVNTARPWSYSTNNDHAQPNGGGVAPTQGNTLGTERPDAEVLVSAPNVVPTSAFVGHAALVGALSVPHSWAMAAPEIRLAVESLPSAGGLSAPAGPDMGGVAPTGLLSGMALASLAGRGATGAGSRSPSESATNEDEQPQRKPTVVVIQKPPPAGGHRPPAPHRS